MNNWKEWIKFIFTVFFVIIVPCTVLVGGSVIFCLVFNCGVESVPAGYGVLMIFIGSFIGVYCADTWW